MGIEFDVMFTSELKRAQSTGQIMLDEMNCSDLYTIKDQKLNERAYGDLTGMNKDEARTKFGEDQVHIWRRSYDTRPPGGESLKDTYDRAVPYFKDTITPELEISRNVLVAAHGNSLRAIVKYLENISETDIVKLEIATGDPIIYKYSDGSYTRS
jgi:2,3-bisphosphoglycerate-dependent phosphoglycerate mutase